MITRLSSALEIKLSRPVPFLFALAFAVFVPPAIWSGGHRVSMLWLIACVTLLTLGELLVAPLSLSMILRLTPPRFIGVVFGGWYVAGALGYWLSGELGAGWTRLAGP